MTPTWTKVTELEPGKVYQQGNVQDLKKMMDWQAKGVLYFGDHVFSDLAVSSHRCSCLPGLVYSSCICIL